MIKKPKDIQKEVAEENLISVDLISSIDNAVFQQLRSCLNDPTELAYELPGICTLNIRFKQFEQYFDNLVKFHPEEKDTHNYQRAQKIVDKIHEYKAKKKEIRKNRYDTITANQSSETDTEEH